MSDYRHTPEMGEISGMGGDYEHACNTMLEAGVDLIIQGNPKLSDAPVTEMEDGSFASPDGNNALMADYIAEYNEGNDAAGVIAGMVNLVMPRLYFIDQNGWEAYVEATKGGNLFGRMAS